MPFYLSSSLLAFCSVLWNRQNLTSQIVSLFGCFRQLVSPEHKGLNSPAAQHSHRLLQSQRLSKFTWSHLRKTATSHQLCFVAPSINSVSWIKRLHPPLMVVCELNQSTISRSIVFLGRPDWFAAPKYSQNTYKVTRNILYDWSRLCPNQCK